MDMINKKSFTDTEFVFFFRLPESEELNSQNRNCNLLMVTNYIKWLWNVLWHNYIDCGSFVLELSILKKCLLQISYIILYHNNNQ